MTRGVSRLGEPGGATALLVDCHDSFTWNVHSLVESLGISVRTVSIDDALLHGSQPHPPGRAGEVPLLILGPGPGRPEHYPLLGELLAGRPARPVLGICLGMQAMVLAGGGRLEVGLPVHGMIDRLRHDAGPEFRNVAQGTGVMRYHSLRVVETGHGIVACAWGGDRTILAVRHEQRPWFGLQYHPESVGSESGRQVVRNILDLWGIACSEEVSR